MVMPTPVARNHHQNSSRPISIQTGLVRPRSCAEAKPTHQEGTLPPSVGRMIMATPLRIDQVASVTRKGWSLRSEISRPLSAPIRKPSTRMINIQSAVVDGSSVKRVAAITVPRLIMPPIDRSMPPRTSTMVWPVAASISVIAAAVSRLISSSEKTPDCRLP